MVWFLLCKNFPQLLFIKVVKNKNIRLQVYCFEMCVYVNFVHGAYVG